MSDLKLCTFIPGHGIGWLMKRRLLPATGASAIASAVTTVLTGGTGGVLICALGALGQAVYVSNFVFSVDEFSYAVVSRADKVLKETRGSGLHEGVIGDEYHIISRNPISVDVVVVRQLRDGSVATVTLQVTVIPHPCIANAQGLNTYGAWVIEGRKRRDSHYAEHHVEEGIKRPLQGLLSTLLAQLTQSELDSMQNALALYVESEVALHTPIHRDPEHRLRVCGTAEPAPEPGAILAWYHARERQCREYLDRVSGEFNDDDPQTIEPNTVSHHEAHVGSIFEHAEVISVSYDKETTEARKAKRIAQEKADGAREVMKVVKDAAKEAGEAGGDPRVAQAIAGAAAGVPGVTVSVISSNDPNIAAAAAAGREAGKGMGGGGK